MVESKAPLYFLVFYARKRMRLIWDGWHISQISSGDLLPYIEIASAFSLFGGISPAVTKIIITFFSEMTRWVSRRKLLLQLYNL